MTVLRGCWIYNFTILHWKSRIWDQGPPLSLLKSNNLDWEKSEFHIEANATVKWSRNHEKRELVDMHGGKNHDFEAKFWAQLDWRGFTIYLEQLGEERTHNPSDPITVVSLWKGAARRLLSIRFTAVTGCQRKTKDKVAELLLLSIRRGFVHQSVPRRCSLAACEAYPP